MKRSRDEIACAEAQEGCGEEEEGVEEEAFRVLAARTDTELVMDDIIRRCGSNCPSIILLHMVYYELSKNKSIVDQEVDRLRQSSSHKILHFPGAKLTGVSGTVVGVIPTHRYMQDLYEAFPSSLKDRGEKASAGEEGVSAIRAKFSAWVQNSTCISISMEALAKEALLTEEHIETLLHAGFLRPRTDAVAGQVDSLWLSHPSFGSVLSRLRAGQVEVTKIVQRRRFKEITETQFHALFAGGVATQAGKSSSSVKVKSSLPSAFHLQDLLGRGCFQKVQRPAGEALLRLIGPN